MSLRQPYGLHARARRGATCRSISQVVFGLEAVSALGAQGVFEKNFGALSGDPDFEYTLIDGHDYQSSPARDRRKRGDSGAGQGRSRGGLTTKIIVLVHALGYLARFIVLPSQRHDSVGVEPLIEDIDFESLIADKAFDQKRVRRELNDRGALAFIPRQEGSQNPHSTRRRDVQMGASRGELHPRLKEWRRITTRYDKTDASSCAFIRLSAGLRAIARTSTGPNRPCAYGPATNPASAAQKSGLSAVGIDMMF